MLPVVLSWPLRPAPPRCAASARSCPLAAWMVMEAHNDSFFTTGITYQADDQKTPTTVKGAGVDVSTLNMIGLSGSMDWGVHAYNSTGSNGIDPRNGASSAHSAMPPPPTSSTRATPRRRTGSPASLTSRSDVDEIWVRVKAGHAAKPTARQLAMSDPEINQERVLGLARVRTEGGRRGATRRGCSGCPRCQWWGRRRPGVGRLADLHRSVHGR
jgi:hypothetical protein